MSGSTDEPPQKTKVCKYWTEGLCKRGDECMWAHSNVEIRAPPDLVKTKLCRLFFKGECTGVDCKFAHGEFELRETHLNPEDLNVVVLESKRERKRRIKEQRLRELQEQGNNSIQDSSGNNELPSVSDENNSPDALPSVVSCASSFYLEEKKHTSASQPKHSSDNSSSSKKNNNSITANDESLSPPTKMTIACHQRDLILHSPPIDPGSLSPRIIGGAPLSVVSQIMEGSSFGSMNFMKADSDFIANIKNDGNGATNHLIGNNLMNSPTSNFYSKRMLHNNNSSPTHNYHLSVNDTRSNSLRTHSNYAVDSLSSHPPLRPPPVRPPPSISASHQNFPASPVRNSDAPPPPGFSSFYLDENKEPLEEKYNHKQQQQRNLTFADQTDERSTCRTASIIYHREENILSNIKKMTNQLTDFLENKSNDTAELVDYFDAQHSSYKPITNPILGFNLMRTNEQAKAMHQILQKKPSDEEVYPTTNDLLFESYDVNPISSNLDVSHKHSNSEARNHPPYTSNSLDKTKTVFSFVERNDNPLCSISQPLHSNAALSVSVECTQTLPDCANDKHLSSHPFIMNASPLAFQAQDEQHSMYDMSLPNLLKQTESGVNLYMINKNKELSIDSDKKICGQDVEFVFDLPVKPEIKLANEAGQSFIHERQETTQAFEEIQRNALQQSNLSRRSIDADKGLGNFNKVRNLVQSNTNKFESGLNGNHIKDPNENEECDALMHKLFNLYELLAHSKETKIPNKPKLQSSNRSQVDYTYMNQVIDEFCNTLKNNSLDCFTENTSGNQQDLFKEGLRAARLQHDMCDLQSFEDNDIKKKQNLKTKMDIPQKAQIKHLPPNEPLRFPNGRFVKAVDDTDEVNVEDIYYENEAPPVTMVYDWAHGIGMEVADLLRHAAMKLTELKWPMLNSLSNCHEKKIPLDTVKDLQDNKEYVYELLGMFHELEVLPRIRISLSGTSLFRMSVFHEPVEIGLDFTWTTPSVSRIVGGVAGVDLTLQTNQLSTQQLRNEREKRPTEIQMQIPPSALKNLTFEEYLQKKTEVFLQMKSESNQVLHGLENIDQEITFNHGKSNPVSGFNQKSIVHQQGQQTILSQGSSPSVVDIHIPQPSHKYRSFSSSVPEGSSITSRNSTHQQQTEPLHSFLQQQQLQPPPPLHHPNLVHSRQITPSIASSSFLQQVPLTRRNSSDHLSRSTQNFAPPGIATSFATNVFDNKNNSNKDHHNSINNNTQTTLNTPNSTATTPILPAASTHHINSSTNFNAFPPSVVPLSYFPPLLPPTSTIVPPGPPTQSMPVEFALMAAAAAQVAVQQQCASYMHNFYHHQAVAAAAAVSTQQQQQHNAHHPYSLNFTRNNALHSGRSNSLSNLFIQSDLHPSIGGLHSQCFNSNVMPSIPLGASTVGILDRSTTTVTAIGGGNGDDYANAMAGLMK